MSHPRNTTAHDPAQAGLFDLDDRNIMGTSPEHHRLAARVAERVPNNAALNELPDVECGPEQLTGEVAAPPLGGGTGFWPAQVRAVFTQRGVNDAVRAARVPARRDPRPGIGHQRRQVAAWLAEGQIYQSIAEASQQPGAGEFRTLEGATIGMDWIDAHLSDAVRRVLRGDGHPPGVGWCGVTVTFHPVDEQTVQMRLSTDAINHARIPVPTSWVSDEHRGRIRRAIADAIGGAQTRATRLIAAANSLADRIEAPPGAAPQPGPAAPAPALVAGSGDVPATCGARVSFLHPPHAQSGPASAPLPGAAPEAGRPPTTHGHQR